MTLVLFDASNTVVGRTQLALSDFQGQKDRSHSITLGPPETLLSPRGSASGSLSARKEKKSVGEEHTVYLKFTFHVDQVPLRPPLPSFYNCMRLVHVRLVLCARIWRTFERDVWPRGPSRALRGLRMHRLPP